MDLRRDLEKKIERKQTEIREWEKKIGEANAYIQAHQETLKMLPRGQGSNSGRSLRPGTSIAKAYEAIKRAGRPMQINEILRAIGRPPDKKNRTALSGSLAHYVREGEIFSRPAPNTFGLIDFESIVVADEEESGGDDGENDSHIHQPGLPMSAVN